MGTRRVTAVLALAVPAVGALAAPPAADHGVDVDCRNFTYQEDAQAHLEAHPGDPDGLDADGNGIACEALPSRGTTTPAPAPPGAPPAAVFYKSPHAPELAPDDLPDNVLVYTLPSRFCVPDMLGNEAWGRFGGLPRGYRRVRAVCDHVHQHLTFRNGSSTALSTAADVYASGYGVCRDFTHLAISFCRALNIPARYVFGYLPDMDVPPDPAPMDFAAWMEVWLGDRWWTFDRLEGRVPEPPADGAGQPHQGAGQAARVPGGAGESGLGRRSRGAPVVEQPVSSPDASACTGHTIRRASSRPSARGPSRCGQTACDVCCG